MWVLSLKLVIVSVALQSPPERLMYQVVMVFVHNGIEEESVFPIWYNLRRHSKRLPVGTTRSKWVGGRTGCACRGQCSMAAILISPTECVYLTEEKKIEKKFLA